MTNDSWKCKMNHILPTGHRSALELVLKKHNRWYRRLWRFLRRKKKPEEWWNRPNEWDWGPGDSSPTPPPMNIPEYTGEEYDATYLQVWGPPEWVDEMVRQLKEEEERDDSTSNGS